MKFPSIRLAAARLIVPFCLASSFIVSLGQSVKRVAPQNQIRNKSVETRCGVRFQNSDELLAERRVDWREIGESKESIIYYSPKRTTCNEKGVLKVWVKFVTKDTSKQLASSMMRYEINCRSNDLRWTAYTDYKKDGSVLKMFTAPAPKFEEPVPESADELILYTVCNKPL